MKTYFVKKEELLVLKLVKGDDLPEQIQTFIDENSPFQTTIFVDFTDIAWFSSSTIAKLIILTRTTENTPHRVFHANMCPEVIRIITVCGLDKLFEMSGTNKFNDGESKMEIID